MAAKKDRGRLSLFCGLLSHPSFSTLLLPPFQLQYLIGKKKNRRKKGATFTLDYFLLIRVIEFLGASLIFTVRISNFFLLFLLFAPLLKLQPTATNNPPTDSASQGSSIYMPSEKSPEFQMSQSQYYLQLAKITRQIIVTCCGQSEAVHIS